jgi:hypothetical protein
LQQNIRSQEIKEKKGGNGVSYSKKRPNKQMLLCEISGSDGASYEDGCGLGCCAM